MPIEATIQREDANHTQTISGFTFPTTPDRLGMKLKQLGFTPENIEQFSITGIDYSHDEYTAEIESNFPESVSLIEVDKLNYLAAIIDGLSGEDQLKLFTLFDYPAYASNFPYECDGLDDMIDLADNMGRFIFLPYVDDIYDLSDALLDQRPLTGKASQQLTDGTFDPIKYAKEVMDSEQGSFVHWGYMAWSGEFEPNFVNTGVPDVYRVWEEAIGDTLPVKFDIQMPDIDYDAVNNGRVKVASLITARNIAELARGGQDPDLFGGEKYKAQYIIEIAHLLETDPAFFPEWLHDCVLSDSRADVVALIDKEQKAYESGGIDSQIEYEIAPVTVQHLADLLQKLIVNYPVELHKDDLLCAMLVARELHRQKVEALTPMADCSFLANADEAQMKAFHLLPSDKQVMMECDYETVSEYHSLVLANSQKMLDIYDKEIKSYVALHKRPALAAPGKKSLHDKLKQGKDAANNQSHKKGKKQSHEL